MKCECDQTTRKRYRYTVNLQSLTGTAGSDGHIDVTNASNWTTNNTLKVNFVSKGGREFLNANKVSGDVTHIVETPSTSTSRAITPDERITWTDPDSTSHTYQIVAAYDVDNMQEVVRIHLREQVI